MEKPLLIACKSLCSFCPENLRLTSEIFKAFSIRFLRDDRKKADFLGIFQMFRNLVTGKLLGVSLPHNPQQVWRVS